MAPRSSRRGPFAVGFLGPEQRQLLTILLERLFDSNRIHSTVQSGAPQTTEQPTTESGRIHLLDTGSPASAPRLNAVGAVIVPLVPSRNCGGGAQEMWIDTNQFAMQTCPHEK